MFYFWHRTYTLFGTFDLQMHWKIVECKKLFHVDKLGCLLGCFVGLPVLLIITAKYMIYFEFSLLSLSFLLFIDFFTIYRTSGYTRLVHIAKSVGWDGVHVVAHSRNAPILLVEYQTTTTSSLKETHLIHHPNRRAVVSIGYSSSSTLRRNNFVPY